jgi:pantoate--beta-alanine ligase
MEVISTSGGVRAFVGSRRQVTRAPCVVVPTMGALHAGHASLIRLGAEIAAQRGFAAGCVVTVFVNPTQFNEAADFARYPRTLEADSMVCRSAGASMVLAPSQEDVYPPGELIAAPALPPQATEPGLEDAARPGHFLGVCQVVARLLDLIRPEVAVFGEKDWQQLQVVRAMVRREGWPVEVVGGPTVREPDGLAMSSRNMFLTGDDRTRAREISTSLHRAGAAEGPEEAERVLRAGLEASGIRPDYAAVRDAATLMPVQWQGRAEAGWRMLVAARVGAVRLLDNAPWPWGGPA